MSKLTVMALADTVMFTSCRFYWRYLADQCSETRGQAEQVVVRYLWPPGGAIQLLGLITLKPDEDPDSYETWVRDVVHPAAMALASITGYEVFRVDHSFRPGGDVPYQFTEVVTVTSLEDVRRDFARPDMAKLLAEFATRADAVFLVGHQIT